LVKNLSTSALKIFNDPASTTLRGKRVPKIQDPWKKNLLIPILNEGALVLKTVPSSSSLSHKGNTFQQDHLSIF